MIEITCKDCGADIEIEYWTLGNNAKLKIKPCLCTVAPEEYEELKEGHDKLIKALTDTQDRYNVLVRKLKEMIDDTARAKGNKAVDV